MVIDYTNKITKMVRSDKVTP